MFKREHLRGPGVFFGIGEERPFYVEKTPSLLMERLRHNATFFYLNYFALTCLLFCLTLLVSPSAIIGIAILAGAWLWLVKASQDGHLRIGSKCWRKYLCWNRFVLRQWMGELTPFATWLISGISIPQKTAVIIMGGISVFALMYLLTNIFWWTLFSSGFLVSIHAFLRDASMHKDMDDVVAMEGDLHLGEESAFLGRV
jgi:hypothetical protein